MFRENIVGVISQCCRVYSTPRRQLFFREDPVLCAKLCSPIQVVEQGQCRSQAIVILGSWIHHPLVRTQEIVFQVPDFRAEPAHFLLDIQVG